jgi:hypothetical protein
MYWAGAVFVLTVPSGTAMPAKRASARGESPGANRSATASSKLTLLPQAAPHRWALYFLRSSGPELRQPSHPGPRGCRPA